MHNLVQLQTKPYPMPFIWSKCDWCGQLTTLRVFGADVICQGCYDGRDGQEPWIEFERRMRG
jgi:hypothetical protein